MNFVVASDTKASRVDKSGGAKRAFDPSKRALQAELERAIKAELVRAEARIRQQAGSKYDGLKVRSSVQALVKSSAGTSSVYDAIVQRILTPTGASETQSAIREAVQRMYPAGTVPKDWTKPLQPWAIAKVAIRTQTSAAPFNTIRPSPGMTLSDLHRQASEVIEKQREGALSFKATIIVSEQKVLVNGTPFKITVNPSGGKQYRTVRFNITALLAALREA